MKTVYAGEPLPVRPHGEVVQGRLTIFNEGQDEPTIFLAGPTPRSPIVSSWRPDALLLFERAGFTGTVLVPEDRGGGCQTEYDHQVEWETEALERASVILFWVPRQLVSMPAFTTNDEWGFWKSSGKCVFGAPPWAEKVRYQRWWATRLGVPQFDTLEDTIGGALVLQGVELRDGGVAAPAFLKKAFDRPGVGI